MCLCVVTPFDRNSKCVNEAKLHKNKSDKMLSFITDLHCSSMFLLLHLSSLSLSLSSSVSHTRTHSLFHTHSLSLSIYPSPSHTHTPHSLFHTHTLSLSIYLSLSISLSHTHSFSLTLSLPLSISLSFSHAPPISLSSLSLLHSEEILTLSSVPKHALASLTPVADLEAEAEGEYEPASLGNSSNTRYRHHITLCYSAYVISHHVISHYGGCFRQLCVSSTALSCTVTTQSNQIM